MSGVDDREVGSDGVGPGGVEDEGSRDGANDGVVEREAWDMHAIKAQSGAVTEPGDASSKARACVEGQVGDSARGQVTESAAADAKLYALGTKHIYRGAFHKGLVGWPVVIVAVLRGEHSLHEQELVGAMQLSDRFEVRPVIKDRLSWVSYDAKPNDLEPTGEVWGS